MDDVAHLLDLQAGVIDRRQLLASGLADHDVRRMLRRRELVVVHPGVYVGHTGEPSWLQLAWAAVRFAWPAALCDESALRAAEGPGGRRAEVVIHVAVDRHRRIAAPAGVRVHRMSGFRARTLWNATPPRLRYEEAALDVAASSASDLDAIGAVAAACQSRRTTARRMSQSLQQRSRTRRRRWLADVLADVAEGACSVLEHGYLVHVERAHRLPRARRQRAVTATLGLTYRDVEYGSLVLELDGRLFHDTARQRDRDLDRDLDAAVAGDTTVRIGYGQVFARPCRTAGRIAVLLRRAGWTGELRRCGPECDLRGAWLSPGDSQAPPS
jgi:hypothetical protein